MIYTLNSTTPMPIPIVISTWPYGLAANDAAWRILSIGGNSLDAVVAGATQCEEDPTQHTVGLGGYPDAGGETPRRGGGFADHRSGPLRRWKSRRRHCYRKRRRDDQDLRQLQHHRQHAARDGTDRRPPRLHAAPVGPPGRRFPNRHQLPD